MSIDNLNPYRPTDGTVVPSQDQRAYRARLLAIALIVLAIIPIGCGLAVTYSFATLSSENWPATRAQQFSQAAAFVAFWTAGFGLLAFAWAALFGGRRGMQLGAVMCGGVLPLLVAISAYYNQ
ncbi:hypothetical protein [Novipirellula aureliae]|uniref:hypothetical protein n=1 Tax=Novipirellula aureliae TaxID=2527966 RepID=UPI0011B69059|nr:hypothetical protein [Novipirellula aureliae]